MRVSLAGVMMNAIRAIEDAKSCLENGYDGCDLEDLMPKLNDSQFMLGEIRKHCQQVINGEETLQEFGRHYCLTSDNQEGK